MFFENSNNAHANAFSSTSYTLPISFRSKRFKSIPAIEYPWSGLWWVTIYSIARQIYSLNDMRAFPDLLFIAQNAINPFHIQDLGRWREALDEIIMLVLERRSWLVWVVSSVVLVSETSKEETHAISCVCAWNFDWMIKYMTWLRKRRRLKKDEKDAILKCVL